MRDLLKPALVLFTMLTLLTGVAYPALVTAIAQAAFPYQANGSLIDSAGRPATAPGSAAGSRLIGQPFSSPGYFWSRPSATSPYPYNAAASAGSNLGPLNPLLQKEVTDRATRLLAADPTAALPVPVDLVAASASGLDPDISPAAALYQVSRVAAARGLSTTQVAALAKQYTTGRTFGLLGEPRVNVLALNLALDRFVAQAAGDGGE
jgi:potassium-transporting ATPase KdpC subunit